MGQSIQLKVTFTDDRGFSESLTSAVTRPVTDSSSTRKLFWLATIVPNEDGQVADYTYNASTGDVNLSPAAFTADQSSVQTITYLGASQDNATKFAIDLSSQLTDQQTATWSLHILDVELDFRNAAYSATSTSPPAHRYQWDVTEYATDTASLPQNGDPLTVSIQEAINLSATGQPTIGGTPQVGDSLNADASAITDGNGLSNVSYDYQWTAGGSNIDGATAIQPAAHLQPGGTHYPGDRYLRRRRRVLLRLCNQRGNDGRRRRHRGQQPTERSADHQRDSRD